MAHKARISIVIPTLNEAGNIAELAGRLDAALQGVASHYELIFVDDKSQDGTMHEIQQLQHRYPVRVLQKIGRRGKSYSILEGAAAAKYDTIAMIDADLQYPPEALPAMIQAVRKKGTGLVIARRTQKGGDPFRSLGTWLTHMLYRTLFGFKLDVQSGLKVFKKQLIRDIHAAQIGPWTLDLRLIIQARKQHLGLASVNTAFDKRHHGRSKVRFLKDGLAIATYAISVKLTEYAWISQAVNFGLIGIVNTALDIVLFIALARTVPIFAEHILYAKVISYGVATLNSFVLNQRFTFRSVRSPRSSLLPFIAVNVIGAGVNSGVLYVSLTTASLERPAALALATIATFGWNFTASKFFVFRKTRQQAAVEAADQ